MRADSCVSVCQPFLVLPPLFDSDSGRALLTQGVRHALTSVPSLIFLFCSICADGSLVCMLLCIAVSMTF